MTSDLTPQTDASTFGQRPARQPITPLLHQLRIVVIRDDSSDLFKSKTVSHGRITEDLANFANEFPEVVNDPALVSVVVIDGIQSAQMYSADTFRWLCGTKPHPNDPDWMG